MELHHRVFKIVKTKSPGKGQRRIHIEFLLCLKGKVDNHQYGKNKNRGQKGGKYLKDQQLLRILFLYLFFFFYLCHQSCTSFLRNSLIWNTATASSKRISITAMEEP